MASITPNSIQQVWDGSAKGQTPIVQVLAIKKIQGPQGAPSDPDKFRIVISDGTFFNSCMLATQRNDMVSSGILKPFCLIRLDEFILNQVRGRKIVILLRLEVVASLENQIGDPSQMPDSPSMSAGGLSGTASVPATTPAPPATTAPTSAPQPGVVPIKSLNPYRNRWTIQARVTAKADIRTWSNQRGEGRLFSVDLLDEQGGEIRATMFNKAVDMFHPLLQVNHVYLISRGQIKYANKQWNPLPNEFELTLDQGSDIREVTDTGAIAHQHFNLCQISNLPDVEPNSNVDVIGVVISVADVASINTKRGDTVEKRELQIVDDSKAQVNLTLWGDRCHQFDDSCMGSVLVVKGARVSDFSGRSLSAQRSGTIDQNPPIAEAQQLRDWFDRLPADQQNWQNVSAGSSSMGGGNSQQRGSDPFKTFREVKDEYLGHDAPSYFVTRATITAFRKDGNPPWYTACPSDGCNKKVHMVNGHWVCDKCHESYNQCAYRYILGLNAADHTGSNWLSTFDDVANQIVGTPAAQMNEWLEHENDRYHKTFMDKTFATYRFKIRAKNEEYNGESRIKYNILSATPMNWVQESSQLIELLKTY